MIRTLIHSLLLVAVAAVPSAAGMVTFDWASVGNPGNAHDIHGAGYGGVDYTYRIGKHEVTNAQYMEFLNAVATVGDAHGLYNTSMAGVYGGIKRTGAGTVADPYAYSVKGGGERPADSNVLDRPVNWVSWGDAARFTNWLHNGQPTGSQDLATTEDGAYYLDGATSDADLRAVRRELDATYFIPSEDEWYKAAYYDPNTDAYFTYPTGSNTAPGYVDSSGNLSGTATPFADGATDPGNYATYSGDGSTNGIGSPYYLTKVGEWENSASPYGTFDQGGNVMEWNEAVIGSSSGGARGGSFGSIIAGLRADARANFDPTLENGGFGFRVAAVPEPSSVLLGALAAVGLLMRRRA